MLQLQSKESCKIDDWQLDWPDPFISYLYKPITMTLSLMTKTVNDTTRKVEGISLGVWTVTEEVLDLQE